MFELGSAHGATEHSHLVTEHDVLELSWDTLPLPGEGSDESNEDEVDQGSQGARDVTCPAPIKCRTGFWIHTRKTRLDEEGTMTGGRTFDGLTIPACNRLATFRRARRDVRESQRPAFRTKEWSPTPPRCYTK